MSYSKKSQAFFMCDPNTDEATLKNSSLAETEHLIQQLL